MADASGDTFALTDATAIADFIIRPPRTTYSRHDLGDREFSVEGAPATREDLTLKNSRGCSLHASHFRPSRSHPDHPTVVYLHGNGSCRVEATTLLPLTIPYGVGVFAFDFSGSGRSEGEYSSLGLLERLDVEAVVEHLVSKHQVRTIILWGYSMGAAAAILYLGKCQSNPAVKTVILDSPFASFAKLAESFVSDMPIPPGIPRKFLLTIGIRAVRKMVRERAQFDVFEIDPLSALRTIPSTISALFVHGTADGMIPCAQGKMLYDSYPCPQKAWLPISNLDHDSPRPESSMDTAFFFIMRAIYDHKSVDYFEALKARGNTAMLSARFADSIFLYSQALLAMKNSIPHRNNSPSMSADTTTTPSGRIALSGRRDRKSSASSKLSRRNSSVPSLIPSVKRWRNRTGVPATPATPSSVPTSQSKAPQDPALTSSTSTASHIVKAPAEEAGDNQIAVFGSSISRRSSDREDRSQRVSAEVLKQPGVKWSGMSVRKGSFPTQSCDPIDKASHKGGVEDDRHSEASGRSGRFGRQKSWRARGVMGRIRMRIRGQFATVQNGACVGAISNNANDKAGPDGTFVKPGASNGNVSAELSGEESVRKGKGKNSRLNEENCPEDQDCGPAQECNRRGLNVKGRAIGGDGNSETRRGARSPRSSSRVRLRNRGRREWSWRAQARAEDDWEASGLDRGDRALDTECSMRDVAKGGKRTGDNKNAHTRHGEGGMLSEDVDALGDMTSWDMDDELRKLTLALLGNRSLARRKAKDNIGALHDASRCLQLDCKWVRGYLRKAAALKEEGRIADAKDVVHKGLSYEPNHAGLNDLLQSLKESLESENDGEQ